MLDLGFVLVVALAAAGLGLRILDGLSPGGERVGRLPLSVVLGLGSMSLAILGLAEFGWLTSRALAILVAVSFAAGIGPIARESRRFRPIRLDVFDLVSALILLGSLLTALAPVTDGDALCYHLQVPKIFLERGAAVFEPDLHETIYPLSTEMLYALALAFRGPVACRLIQWVLGLAFAASVAALARPALGDRSRWAAAIALGVPAISNGMGAPLNDVALAAFGNAALVAFFRWRGERTAGSAILAGSLAGMAIGVKYPALVWAGLIGSAMIASSCKRDGRRWRVDRSSMVQAGRFGGSALLIGGGWYLRAFHHTGNPVFPFFRVVFGSGLDDVLDPIKRPMAVNAWNLLTAIGPLTLDPARFESVAHQFGPAFLLLVPGLFLLKPPGRVVGIAAIGWAFLTLCLTQRQSMRFVLIAVGPFSVAAAWVASAWRDRPTIPARLLVSILIAVLLAESAIALGRSRHGLSVVFGLESGSEYLDRREPTYRVGRWMAGNLPEDARVIGQDHRGFYLPRPYAMELAHRRRTGLGKRGESAPEVVDRLRQGGFTHLMLCPPVPESAVEFDATLGRLLAPWLAGRSPIYREAIADPDGVARLYAIYPLDDAAVARRPIPERRR